MENIGAISLFIGLLLCIGFLLKLLSPVFISFWSYREMRLMVAACVVISFYLLVFPRKIEVNHNVRLEVKDAGYPIQLEIRNR